MLGAFSLDIRATPSKSERKTLEQQQGADHAWKSVSLVELSGVVGFK
jgi:hypothetical protein